MEFGKWESNILRIVGLGEVEKGFLNIIPKYFLKALGMRMGMILKGGQTLLLSFPTQFSFALLNNIIEPQTI